MDDFGQFDTFSACITIDERHESVVDRRKRNRSAMIRLCIKKGRAFGTEFLNRLGLGIS